MNPSKPFSLVRPETWARTPVRAALLGPVLRASAAALVVLVLSTATAFASSSISRTDLAGTTFANPCTVEQIVIVGGTFQLIVNSTVDAAGAIHLDIRGNAQGVVARGNPSGLMYRLSGDFWSEQTIRNASYPMTLTVVEVHNAVSSGDASNFVVEVTRHLTVSATGETTATVDNIRATCRG
jgi:hypothetical protein